MGGKRKHWKSCSAPGCDKLVTKEYCRRHRKQLSEIGHFVRNRCDKDFVPKYKQKCKFEGCQNLHARHGYCSTHAYRVEKYGTPNLFPNGRKNCKICGEVRYKYWFCQVHYEEWAKLNPDKIKVPVPKEARPPKKKCSVEYCTELAYCFGMCNRHRSQFLLYGKTSITRYDRKNLIRIDGDHAVLTMFNKQGEASESMIDIDDMERVKRYSWYLTSYGYAVSFKAGQLHRFVLNVPPHTQDKRVVHHINHNRSDNRKQNLQIITPIENRSDQHQSRLMPLSQAQYDQRRNKRRAMVAFYGPYRDSKGEALIDSCRLLELRNRLYDQLMKFKIEKADGYNLVGYAN